jgi:hypothetical protein
MSEETTLSTTEETVTTTQVAQNFDPFNDEGWVEPANVDTTTKITTNVEEPPKTEETTKVETQTTPNYLKDLGGWETEESAKEEIQNLRKLKDSVPKFANEESEKVYKLLAEGKVDEVTEIYSQKKRISNLITGEVNEKTASDMIKLNLQVKHKDLTPDEIDFIYNQKYSVPEKPEQGLTEEDDEYNKRVSTWNNQVEAKRKELIIDAKLARPELEKLNTELTLPDISQKVEVSKEPTPEDVEAAKKLADAFREQGKKTVSEFDGFTATIKNDEVEIPVVYSLSDDEKLQVNEKLNQFAESGFNANALFAQRWVKKDGSLNVSQITRDWALLLNDGNISKKYVNDAAAKMIAHQKQVKSNIKVTGQNETFNPGQKSQQTEMADTIWSA